MGGASDDSRQWNAIWSMCMHGVCVPVYGQAVACYLTALLICGSVSWGSPGSKSEHEDGAHTSCPVGDAVVIEAQDANDFRCLINLTTPTHTNTHVTVCESVSAVVVNMNS